MFRFIIFLIFTTCLSQISCNNSTTNDTIDLNENLIDFNYFYTYVTKYSAKKSLKSCFDNESHTVSIKSLNDMCVLRDLKHDSLVWNEKHIKNYLFSNFLIANLTENVRKQTIESKTNLRRFINQIDEYTDETKLEIEMPQFLKDNINFDSLIECETEEFKQTKMKFYLNYEKFSNDINSNNLVCLIKGNLSVLAIEDSSLENLKINEKKLTKRILKGINYYDEDLKPNECLYVPSFWKYTFKSNFAWFYQIPLNVNCVLKSNQENTSLLTINNLYPLDTDFVAKFKLIVHFTLYLNSTLDRKLNKTEFIKLAQGDKLLLKSKCDYECKDILKKVFYILDSNIDDVFNQEDLDQFDELALVDFNKKLTNMVSKLDKINQKHMDNINQFVEDLKNFGYIVAKELNLIIGSEVTDLLKDYSLERLNKMVKEFNLNDFMSSFLKKSKEKSTNSRPTKKKEENIFEDKAISANEESIFDNESEIVDEIIADDEDHETKINENLVNDKNEL